MASDWTKLFLLAVSTIPNGFRSNFAETFITWPPSRNANELLHHRFQGGIWLDETFFARRFHNTPRISFKFCRDVHHVTPSRNANESLRHRIQGGASDWTKSFLLAVFTITPAFRSTFAETFIAWPTVGTRMNYCVIESKVAANGLWLDETFFDRRFRNTQRISLKFLQRRSSRDPPSERIIASSNPRWQRRCLIGRNVFCLPFPQYPTD